MKKIVIGLFTIAMILWYGIALAQTLTTDASAGQKTWEVLLKILFPVIWTGISPLITLYISKGIGELRPEVKIAVSTVLGAVMAGVAGTVPDFPLTVESAATMGAGGGATGQFLYNVNPTKTTEQAIKSGIKEGIHDSIEEVKESIAKDNAK